MRIWKSSFPVVLLCGWTTVSAQTLVDEDKTELDLRGSFYVDWFRAAYENDLIAGQLSNRWKMELGPRSGRAWRLHLDIRDRMATAGGKDNQLIIYDAYLEMNDRAKSNSLTLGQMNLYDSAGVGTLLGGLISHRFSPAVTAGGYGGLVPRLYDYSVEPSYLKYGVFARYEGTDAASLSMSYNAVRFKGNTEREFLYTSALIPLDRLVVYGNLEYELGPGVQSADRLSRVFVNARLDLSEAIDVTANLSTGKGLDYHRLLLDQSQDPGLGEADLERFYYSMQYGVRVGVRLHPRLRVYIDQRRSEQKDRVIVNNTTLFGGSARDIAGFSLHGSYGVNRGDLSESNSFRLSLSRNLGSLTWTGYFSSSFNAIRFDDVSNSPSIIHNDDHWTISNDFFYVLTRAIALSLEYQYSLRGDEREHTVFTRAIYRF